LFSLTERGDYFTDCSTGLPLNGPEEHFTINITIPSDNDALEGTEVFLLIPTLDDNILARNIFFQHTSIQIHDTTGNYVTTVSLSYYEEVHRLNWYHIIYLGIYTGRWAGVSYTEILELLPYA